MIFELMFGANTDFFLSHHHIFHLLSIHTHTCPHPSPPRFLNLPTVLCIGYRAVARSENLGGHIVLGGDNVLPLVEIGLTDLPKQPISSSHVPSRPTQGLIEILGFMVIFDENQGLSDLSKYEFLCPIYVKIIKFLVI